MTFMDFISYLGAMSGVFYLGVLLDKHFVEPGRRDALLNKKIREFEAKIPHEKFMYLKTECPYCQRSLSDWSRTT